MSHIKHTYFEVFVWDYTVLQAYLMTIMITFFIYYLNTLSMCSSVFTQIRYYGFVSGIKYHQHNKVIHNIDL